MELIKTENKINTFVIPPGATYLLQPIDLSVGKPFKYLLRKSFSSWFDNNHQNYTAKGNMPNPKQIEIIKWIKNSKKDFNKDILVNSFKIAGLVNNLDDSDFSLIGSNLQLKAPELMKIFQKYSMSNSGNTNEDLDDKSSYKKSFLDNTEYDVLDEVEEDVDSLNNSVNSSESNEFINSQKSYSSK